MVAATVLNLGCRGYLQWHDLHTEFHKNRPTGSKVDRRDRHENNEITFCTKTLNVTDYLIS
jgi:hypothetical protein